MNVTEQELTCLSGKILSTSMVFLIISCSASQDVHVPEGKCDAIADYDISFSRFDETAQQLPHGTGCFIRADLSRMSRVSVNPVKGRMTIREALHTALAGTVLKVTEQQADSMTVR
ncbi:hypothetical protein QDF68_001051 [Klebsiella pneumoniae]|nr:hypothetical protein [Klebsiella pneumoniae]